jgi:uncharacterized DUF497 family protein
MKISWDESKREKVIKDHGIDLQRVVDVFDDPFGVYIEDPGHSTDEETRFNIIGLSAAYGLTFVAFTYDEAVHLITARRAEKWMVKEYEKERKRV